MRSSFIAATLLAVASLVAGIAVVKEDVVDVLTTLRATTDGIVPQIISLARSGDATEENLTPLIEDLTSAANTAAVDLEESRANGHSPIEIASVTAGIFTEIANALNVASEALPSHPSIVSLAQGDLAAALGMVLTGVETVLSGVIDLVGALLSDVAQLLLSLALDLLPAPTPTAAA